MKKYLLVFIMVLFTSCVDKSLYDKDEIVARCETFMDFNVPISKNAITVVCLNKDTVAVTNQEMTIKIPKTFVSTRGNNLYISYIDKENPVYEFLEKHTYSAYWQAVMFEDSRSGDYDFNDLVIHVKSKTEFPWNKNIAKQTIEIQPIALGSTKPIILGCVLSDGSKHIISRDVRADLFNNQTGFINTEDTYLRYKLSPTIITSYEMPIRLSNTYWICWFISTDNMTQYAISGDYNYENYDEVVDNRLLPYGLVVANNNGTFEYPQERISIFNVYPSFKEWVYNGFSDIGSPNKELVYKYSISGSIDGKYKIWDYLDLQ